MEIQFISKIREFKLSNIPHYRKILSKCAQEEKRTITRLLYYFVSEQEILTINSKFLNHNFITDIISFDNSFLQNVEGEIFICISEVKKNARLHNALNFTEELNRVILHGLLHLIGYKDGNVDDRKIMRSKEANYLQYFS